MCIYTCINIYVYDNKNKYKTEGSVRGCFVSALEYPGIYIYIYIYRYNRYIYIYTHIMSDLY